MRNWFKRKSNKQMSDMWASYQQLVSQQYNAHLQNANLSPLQQYVPGAAANSMYNAGINGPGQYALGELQHKPDPSYPNTLGWRSWSWDIVERKLYSPTQGTLWEASELRCEGWSENAVVRGEAGIHAMLVPEKWADLDGPSDYSGGGMARLVPGRDGALTARVGISGIVERFGKFVLGTDGWRAEWVVIRKLSAPTDEIGLALEATFPDVEVIYGDR